MRTRFINFCDKVMVFSFCLLVGFIPISTSLTEWGASLALVFYLLKRLTIFIDYIIRQPQEWQSVTFINKISSFFKAFKPLHNALNFPIAIFILINFISLLTSQYIAESFMGFLGKTLQGTFVFFTFIECIHSKERLKLLLKILLGSSILVGINGIYQYYYGVDFLRERVVYDGRISSSFRAHNDFGGYLVAILPIYISFIIYGIKFRKSKEEVLASRSIGIGVAVGLVILLFCLGLTYSRGAWLAFILSLSLFGLVSRKALNILSVLVVIFVIVFGASMIQTRHEVHDVWRMINMSSGRSIYWREAANIIKDYPLFGAGINTYSQVGAAYKIDWGGYPHNCFLQMTAEIGVLGLASFMYILILFVRQSLIHWKNISAVFLRSVQLGVLIGVIGFLIHAFFDTILYSVQLGYLVWLMMAVNVSIQRISKQPNLG